MFLIAIFVNAAGICVSGSVPMFLTWLAGAGWISPLFGIAGVITWVGIYVSKGWLELPEKDFCTIERFGRYYRTAHEGVTILCFPGLIDKVTKKGNHRYETVKIREVDPKDVVDFTGGGTGAPVLDIVFRVIRHKPGKPAEVKIKRTDPATGQTWEDTYTATGDITDSGYLWSYNITDGKERVKEVILGALRPLLQGMTVDQAGTKTGDISKFLREDGEIAQVLVNMGVELDPLRGVVLLDIRLPESVVADNEETLKGQKAAERQTLQGLGYMRAVGGIVREAKDVFGIDLTFEQARDLYQNQRGLETLAAKQGAINFVAPGMNGVLASMNMSGGNNP
jgi:hypothetical protein